MESTPSEEAEGQAIVRVLAVVLDRLVSANSHLAETPQEQTHFHAQRAPAIGILQYLERIHKYASCSKECFILALIYIDRLIQRNNFLLTELNVHRVVITAVLLAAKFFDDAYYNNAYYAKVGGVLVEEMNNLECQFLFKIDFSLRVLPEVFDKYSAELIQHSSAIGLDMIQRCTDDELFHPQPQKVASQPQDRPEYVAPELQNTYTERFLDPVMHPNLPAPAPVAVEGMGSHYPIQAFQQSLVAPVPQVQVQVAQQQQTVPLDPVYPFPNLAAQVSAQQQSQVPPAHHPSELDLVYHNATTAAPQDVSCQYNLMGGQQALHQAVPQAQLYPRQVTNELNPPYHGLNMAAQAPQVAPAPMTQAPAYAHQPTNNYFNNPGMVQSQAPMAALQQPQQLQSYPEITPSPPAQPPIPLHGAPIAYQHGEMNLSSSVAYLKSTAVAVAALQQGQVHHQPQCAQHHYNYNLNPTDAALGLHLHQSGQLLPSHPIAIGNSQDVGPGSWSRVLTLERGAGTAGSG